MEQVIESFRDGFTAYQFEYKQCQSPSSVNNVLILVCLVSIVAAGYVYFKNSRREGRIYNPKKSSRNSLISISCSGS